MLTKLGQRGHAVREELGECRVSQFYSDSDSDTDSMTNETTPKPRSCLTYFYNVTNRPQRMR